MPQSLTDLTIRKLLPRGSERVEIWDARVPGFGLRVSPTGNKSFILVYRHNGRPRRMTLGKYPIISLTKARTRAIDALGEVARGIDPQAAKVAQRSAVRFDETVDLFVRTYCREHHRESSRRVTEGILKARFVRRWNSRDIREISKADVIKVLDDAVEAGAPSAANHALACIRVFFNWCVDRGLIDTSPCTRLKRPAKTISRDRVLDDKEIRRIWDSAEMLNYPFGTIVQILLLTGQRRGEVVKMQWSDIDLDTGQWSIPGELTKNGAAHLVPLVPKAVGILNRIPHIHEELVFPSRAGYDRTFSGFSKSKGRLDILAGVDGWTLHDLRRSIATHLARLGVLPHVIERLLNHVGVLGGIAGVYNRFKYVEEVRAALVLWTEYLEGLLGGKCLSGGALAASAGSSGSRAP